MSEARYRQSVVKGLRKLRMDPVSVENGLTHPGTPDINWLHGWIELKVIPKWPVRPETVVRCSTFTPQQRIWLRRRWNANGSAYLLARIGRNHLLFNGADAADYFGEVRREILEDVAEMNVTHLDYKLLLQHLLVTKYVQRR